MIDCVVPVSFYLFLFRFVGFWGKAGAVLFVPVVSGGLRVGCFVVCVVVMIVRLVVGVAVVVVAGVVDRWFVRRGCWRSVGTCGSGRTFVCLCRGSGGCFLFLGGWIWRCCWCMCVFVGV